MAESASPNKVESTAAVSNVFFMMMNCANSPSNNQLPSLWKLCLRISLLLGFRWASDDPNNAPPYESNLLKENGQIANNEYVSSSSNIAAAASSSSKQPEANK